jgi:hypothetical protein
MKLRIWRNCLVVAELEIDDETLLVGRTAFREDGRIPNVQSFIGEESHISIDPWNRLAGEVQTDNLEDGIRSRSNVVAIGLKR